MARRRWAAFTGRVAAFTGRGGCRLAPPLAWRFGRVSSPLTDSGPQETVEGAGARELRSAAPRSRPSSETGAPLAALYRGAPPVVEPGPDVRAADSGREGARSRGRRAKLASRGSPSRLARSQEPASSRKTSGTRDERWSEATPAAPRSGKRRSEATPAAPRLAAGAARWILTALALAIVGCDSSHTTLEDWLAKVDWFPTMRRQPSIEAYEEPRLPAEGTLPVDGRIPLSLVEAERIVRSPVPATAASLERGQTQYDVFCTVCHGPEGSGGGNIAVQQTGFPPGLIATLTSERARGLTDGYLYGMILNGRGLMPHYRRIPEEDRWHIVNYVRALQRRAAAAAQGGGP